MSRHSWASPRFCSSHSYLQSGYTFVNGAAMNYRQWYSSLGFRFDHGKPDAGEAHLMPK